MGICKCKRRTDLFCFVHKKAVCEHCIVSEHLTCAIRTYVDWLTDSDYDQPVCGICKGDLTPDNVVRLTCLDMFHPECLDMHASSLPPHTARAGYLCPSCSKPIFPSDESSPLAQHLLRHLAKAPWSSTLVTGKIPDPIAPSFDGTQSISSVASPNTSFSKDHLSSPLSLPSPPMSPLTPISPLQPSQLKRVGGGGGGGSDNNNINDSSSFGSRRKEQLKEHAINVLNLEQDEDDEDKYKKRSITQLFVALGLLKPTKPSTRKARGIRLDTRRILILVALITCLITVLVMGMSLTTENPLDDGANNSPNPV